MEIIVENEDILEEKVSRLQVMKRTEYPAQFVVGGLNVWDSGIISQLIKEAARCNNYNSDVVYTINALKKAFREFSPNKEFETHYVGFRKHGVDDTEYVVNRLKEGGSLYDMYFAFYSVAVVHEEDSFYNVVFTQYCV